jgi:hypothetical protein
MRATAIALRELMQHPEPDDTSRDLAAFIGLTLEAVAETIEPTVAAWEKRGYWLKADRFRLDWEWARQQGRSIRQAVLADDWGLIAQSLVQIAQQLGDVKVSQNHRLGRPWVGSYKYLRANPE